MITTKYNMLLKIGKRIKEAFPIPEMKFNMFRRNVCALIKDPLVISRIEKNRNVSIEDIDRLARDIPLYTLEYYCNSDFYGTAHTLKKFAGFSSSYKIKAAIEHGFYINDFIWDEDINNGLPAIISVSRKRVQVLSKKTNKTVIPLGPYIHYADLIPDQKDLDIKKRELGNVLLVFPCHSTHYVKNVYDKQVFISIIKELSKNYDTTIICLYWADILKGDDEIYLQNGFKCVTAGHIYDKYFLQRLKEIISYADMVISNSLGSYIGYCIYMNKPFYLYKQKYDSFLSDNVKNIEQTTSDTYNLLVKTFSELRTDISDTQKELVSYLWGFDKVKKKDQLKEAFDKLEELFKKKYRYL